MKFSFEIKLDAVKSYLSGHTEKQVTEQYGVNRTDLFTWVERYRQHGEDGLRCSLSASKISENTH